MLILKICILKMLVIQLVLLFTSCAILTSEISQSVKVYLTIKIKYWKKCNRIICEHLYLYAYGYHRIQNYTYILIIYIGGNVSSLEYITMKKISWEWKRLLLYILITLNFSNQILISHNLKGFFKYYHSTTLICTKKKRKMLYES